MTEGNAELSGAGMPSAIWAEEELMAKAEYLPLASLVPSPAFVKSPCSPLGSISLPPHHVWSRWGACSGGRSWIKAEPAVTAYLVGTGVV